MTRAFDLLGNIAVVNFREKISLKEKKKFAENLLKKNSQIKTVLEKVGKVKGRLRKISTRHLVGEKTKEVLYKENGCVFRFNIDKTYFSPRLSNERKEIASKIKKGEEVLVMFAGVGPFSIVIAKNSKAGKVFSNEINRKANEYAELNLELNKAKDKVFLLEGDVKKVVNKLHSLQSRSQIKKVVNVKNFKVSSNLTKGFGVNNLKNRESDSERAFEKIPAKFNTIIMPRPQLKETFLKEAFTLSRKDTRIFYYDFCKEDEIDLVVEKIQSEAKKYRRKIKILKTKKVGEIAPYKIRVRVEIRVL